MTDREELVRLLNDIESNAATGEPDWEDSILPRIKSAKAAALSAQGPVAWIVQAKDAPESPRYLQWEKEGIGLLQQHQCQHTPLYASPPPAQQGPSSDRVRQEINDQINKEDRASGRDNAAQRGT